MRLSKYINEAEIPDEEKKKLENIKIRKEAKNTLMVGLRKLEDHMDQFVEEIENEVDKINDNPTFKYSLSLMLANMEKESAEYEIALRQIVQTIGKKAAIIPQVRGHAKGAEQSPFEDDTEDAREVVEDDEE